MKKTLQEIFDDLNAEELDLLLEGSLDSEVLDDVTAERTKEAVLKKLQLSRQGKKGLGSPKKRWGKIAAAAACAILLLSAGIGTYAYAAEQKEYSTAVQFFNHYALSTEGLSRGEIKAVYRDITTNSFTYSVTAKVIEKSISDTLAEGFEITQEEPTPEEIKSLWYYKNGNWYARPFGVNTDAPTYTYRFDYKWDETRGIDVPDKSWLEKQKNGEIIWSVSFTEFDIEGYKEFKDGVIVYGDTLRWSYPQTSYAWLAKVDVNGNLLWKVQLENGFHDESVAAILENADGTYAVFSYGRDFIDTPDYFKTLEYLCFSQYDTDGNLLHSNKTDIDNFGIWNAARFGDGYIVQLGNRLENENAKIVKVDSSGSITDSFSYSSGDCYYYITDMTEFEGNIYLSGYSVPTLPDEEKDAGDRCDIVDDDVKHFDTDYRGEIAAVLNYLFDNQLWEITSEELTPMVREQYTALLLICEPDTGTPQEFYSVKGSLGGALSIDSTGNLLWQTESITTTFFSPPTNMYTIGGTCTVFEYSFDKNGSLMSQKKTELVTPYYR